MAKSYYDVVKMSVANSKSVVNADDKEKRVVMGKSKKPLLLFSFFPFSVSRLKADDSICKHESERNEKSLVKKVNIGELIRSSYQNVDKFDVGKHDNLELRKQMQLLKNLVLKIEGDLKQLQSAGEIVEKVRNEVEFVRKVVNKCEYEDLSSVDKCLEEKKQLLDIIDYLCKKNIYLLLLIKEILIHYLEVLSKDKGEIILELFQRKKRLVKMISYALRFGIPLALQKLPIF